MIASIWKYYQTCRNNIHLVVFTRQVWLSGGFCFFYMERNCEQCNKSFLARKSDIKSGGGKFCGRKCYFLNRSKVRTKNITGEKFNRWTAIRFSHKSQNLKSYTGGFRHYWVFQCDCGTIKVLAKSDVVRGQSKSCGCLKTETTIKRSTKHGMCHSRFYNIWTNMLARCNNPSSTRFKYYGGRGISIEWPTFESFMNDMYERYLDHVRKFGETDTEIDRIDVNGNYSKENCRWATSQQQARNTSRNKFTYQGKTQSLIEWAEEYNISYDVLRNRIRKWPFKKALTTPVKK